MRNVRLSTRSLGAMLRGYARRHRRLIIIEAFFLVVLVGGVFWAIIDLLQLLPPRTVTMATGPEGGAYHGFGERYRKILAHEGFDLRLKQTAGAVENLRLLNDTNSGVSISFLQAGLATERNSPGLVSLGTVFYEPLWFFGRGVGAEGGREALQGRRISIGPEGSGTRSLALELLARNGITNGFATLLPFPPEETSQKLLSGQIDAALLLASYSSPVVQRLLAAEDIQIASFPRADAYVALYPFLNKLVVPAGMADLANNRPTTNTVLLAAKASLVVRADLHPAIQYLLLKAAEQVHSQPGVFHTAGRFPAAESEGLPLSEQARQFYRSGQPFLQRHLPIWLAALAGRLLIFLIPLLGILYPLFRFLPVWYGWQMRRRVLKLYRQLRSIEYVWETQGARGPKRELVSQLEQLKERADQLWVPVSSIWILYLFKEHITQVRQQLEAQMDPAGPPVDEGADSDRGDSPAQR
jgi:TRAP-type uncharacterized transport system substrate-binding protein